MGNSLSEKIITLTPLERNCLFVVDPYEDGVEVNLEKIKPEVIATWRDLGKRGFIKETSTSEGLSFIQLTDKGREAIQP